MGYCSSLSHFRPCRHIAMLLQAVRLASRQAVVAAARPLPNLARQHTRAFGAVVQSHAEKAIARPFQGASRSEPEMEYIEEPSMLYMTCLVAAPWVFSFWFLTKFV